MSTLPDWIPGPTVPDYDGPTFQCASHVIATKCDGAFLSWALFDRLRDGTLRQRFRGSSLSGEGTEDLSRLTQLATEMLNDDCCVQHA
jgi:hypothetical protein